LLRGYEAFRDPSTQLTLVGSHAADPSSLGSYRDLFRHVPHVTQQQLADLYRQADVFVFPTLLEGLGLVVLEAMASGLPVITTASGPSDVVRDGVDGFVVPIRDSVAIAERLDFLRNRPEVRLAMGRNARERALQFTWSAYREKAAGFLMG
jgi:glycosyltransferase involved in cell wall biosynthesis